MNHLQTVILILAIAFTVHLIVLGVERFGKKYISAKRSASLAKTITVAGLIKSVTMFSLYFGSLGFILSEFGVSLTAYLASASILGLAIGFGSQGLVQDLVAGLTLIFADLIDVGDTVEISGQSGIVKKIGMRFTVLENSLGSLVAIPNRTISNVISYPRGYIRCFADIMLSKDVEHKTKMEKVAELVLKDIEDQFPGIFRAPPEFMGCQKSPSGKEFLRIKFRIWPGRGSPLETVFKQEIIQNFKAIDPNYSDWMVSVNYEVA
ncbi:MAG: mechanosensitive ion channel protein MscS [Nitrospinae bacterium CG22_combo_CG10-13_8_21_14_all_47_10]|nr:MAG: mechanosensitive ion channel protein MscS [Nitrospinae bacterium CG22_combo_CG10-13_8_21_14_all_47_10]